MIATAGMIDTKEGRVWIPPTGRPYWVTGKHVRNPSRAGTDFVTAEQARQLGIPESLTESGSPGTE